MKKVNEIKLHPIELYSEVANCIAYCIGASYEDVEEIANAITHSEIADCIELIRNRISNNQYPKLECKRFVKVTDDWYPCINQNQIEVYMLLIYTPDDRGFVRISAWGKDDFGLAMDYESKNYYDLVAKYNEWKQNIFDKVNDGIDKEWFYNRGFEEF